MRTKKGEKEKLRAEILGKAICYLKKHGRSGAGTHDIMNAMGLTKGALYSHFKSKDDLFAQAVCHDLRHLEDTLSVRLKESGDLALRKIIEDHLSERSLEDVGMSCAFTSLSSDMQRCKAAHRGMVEECMVQIYARFEEALQRHFPDESSHEIRERAENLYSFLVGTLTMARTMKDGNRARCILASGRKYLIRNFSPNPAA